MLNAFNFHCYHFGKNNTPVTIEIFYSLVEHEFMITYLNTYHLIILYNNFERNYFVF